MSKEKNPVGAPRKLDGGKRRNIYLDDASIAEALALSPVLSEGVRIALAASAKQHGRNHEAQRKEHAAD